MKRHYFFLFDLKIRSPPYSIKDIDRKERFSIKQKRRRFKDNPYYIDYNENQKQYIISFVDSKGLYQQVEVDYEIYNVFDIFELKDLSIMNEFDNHIEHFNLSENEIYKRSTCELESVESIVSREIMIEDLIIKIHKLPEIQRRRIIKYFFQKKTYEEIGLEEKCSKRAIKFSVDIGLKKLSEQIKKDDYTFFL